VVRLLGYVVGGLAAIYVVALFAGQRICDEGSCANVPTWKWIVFVAVAIVGLGYSLGPWWRKRDTGDLRRELQQPPRR